MTTTNSAADVNIAAHPTLNGGETDEDEIHELAWAFLQKWNLVPRPAAYEVAYLYFEGGHQEEINTPIDAAISKSNGLCEYDLQQIHDGLRERPDSDLFNKLNAEFANIHDVIKRQSVSSDSYSKNLHQKNKEISKVNTIEQFRDMLSGLIQANDRMLGETRELRNELQRSSEQVEELRGQLEASHDRELEDPLTNIGNRRYFDEWLAKELNTAQRDGSPLCLAIADLDKFKLVNDSYGHPVGDAVLTFFAQLIRSNIKGRDRAARYGGEEFAIILPDTKLRGAVKLIDKIRRDLHARNILIVEDQIDIGKVTSSFGVAEYVEGQSPEAFVKAADAKLYEAKRAGRNCVKF